MQYRGRMPDFFRRQGSAQELQLPLRPERKFLNRRWDYHCISTRKAYRSSAFTFHDAITAQRRQAPHACFPVLRAAKLPGALEPEPVDDEAGRSHEIGLSLAALTQRPSGDDLARVGLLFRRSQAILDMQLAGTAVIVKAIRCI